MIYIIRIIIIALFSWVTFQAGKKEQERRKFFAICSACVGILLVISLKSFGFISLIIVGDLIILILTLSRLGDGYNFPILNALNTFACLISAAFISAFVCGALAPSNVQGKEYLFATSAGVAVVFVLIYMYHKKDKK